MEVIYGLIPGMAVLGLVMVGVLYWAARTGQYDDMDGDAHRILMDEEPAPPKAKPAEPKVPVEPSAKDGPG